jgi:hypothetical protein
MAGMRPLYALSGMPPAPTQPAPLLHTTPRWIPSSIDWDRDPDALARGSLTGLAQPVVDSIMILVNNALVRQTAVRLRIAPTALVIGLLAFLQTAQPSAQRIARALLQGCDTAEIESLCRALNLIDA